MYSIKIYEKSFVLVCVFFFLIGEELFSANLTNKLDIQEKWFNILHGRESATYTQPCRNIL